MKRKLVIPIIVWIVLLLQGGAIHAQSRQSLEARLLFTFINHVEWQVEKPSVNIGVLGNSRILTEINTYIKKNNLPHRVGKIDYVEEASKYDLVVVPAGLGLDINALLEVVGTQNILTVAEEKKIANKEIDICFVDEEGKLRFVVNQTNANKKGLIMGDKLLDYASEIH